jgi:uncharacterized membrane protein
MGHAAWLNVFHLNRFHAWQSALVFTAIMIVHLIFAWSRFLSWLLFIGDIALVALLTMRAYKDAEILDRQVLWTV